MQEHKKQYNINPTRKDQLFRHTNCGSVLIKKTVGVFVRLSIKQNNHVLN